MATESLQAPLFFFAHYLSSAHRGLEGRMKCATFTYNAHFQAYQKDTFALVCTPFLCHSPGSLAEPPVNYPGGSQKNNCTPKNKQTNKQKTTAKKKKKTTQPYLCFCAASMCDQTRLLFTVALRLTKNVSCQVDLNLKYSFIIPTGLLSEFNSERYFGG